MHKDVNRFAATDGSRMAELQAKIASQVGGKQEFEALTNDPRNAQGMREFCKYEFVTYIEGMSDNQVIDIAKALREAESANNRGTKSAGLARAFGLFIRSIA